MNGKRDLNPYVRYLGKCITVLTYSGQKIEFKPMGLATDRTGQDHLIGPDTMDYETVRIPTKDILSVWRAAE